MFILLNDQKKIRFIILFTSLICFSFFPSCGKRRPPVPPTSRTTPISDSQISGIQRGDKILLQIPLTSAQQFKNIRQADVYRLTESPQSPVFLTEDEFASRSTLIGSVRIEDKPNTLQSTAYIDSLNLTSETHRLRYAIRFVNADNQKTAFSNFLLVEPTVNVAQSPLLNDFKLLPDAIVITFSAPTLNLDESKPVNIIGYNIYRISENQNGINKSPELLTVSPITGTTFADKTFKFRERYAYFVRAVSDGADGKQIESSDSNLLSVLPIDTFPPEPPEGVTIAAAPGRLSLFFAANSEADVIGYNVYRSNDSGLPPARWQLLNEMPLLTTTFQDERVESGQKYFYYLKAVDSTGNISTPSEIVSEIVP